MLLISTFLLLVLNRRVPYTSYKTILCMAIYPYYYDYICYCGEWAVAMTVHCKPTYTWRSHTPGALEGRSAHVRGGCEGFRIVFIVRLASTKNEYIPSWISPWIPPRTSPRIPPWIPPLIPSPIPYPDTSPDTSLHISPDTFSRFLPGYLPGYFPRYLPDTSPDKSSDTSSDTSLNTSLDTYLP